MKNWYEGYRFSPEAREIVFNPTICLFFLMKLKMCGGFPHEIFDSNLGLNRDRLEAILKLGDKSQIEEILQSAIKGEAIPFKSQLSNLNLNKQTIFSRSEILSILFTLGFLTYSKDERASLVIPNRAIREQLLEP